MWDISGVTLSHFSLFWLVSHAMNAINDRVGDVEGHLTSLDTRMKIVLVTAPAKMHHCRWREWPEPSINYISPHVFYRVASWTQWNRDIDLFLSPLDTEIVKQFRLHTKT